jgi:F-box protein 11
LRFEPFTNPQVGKTLERLTRAISETLTGGRHWNARGVERQVTKTEPPTSVVDPLNRGDFTTVSEAIARAASGQRIVVRPGLYMESLVIAKPLEIVGDGEAGDVVIQSPGASVILFKASMGRVANLTLRHSSLDEVACVDIAQGRLELDDCEITSLSGACISISGAPHLRRNLIHNGRRGGIIVGSGGSATAEDNLIYNNGVAGVIIGSGGYLHLRRNSINGNAGAAVQVEPGGGGLFEENDLRDNVGGVWSIAEGALKNVMRSLNVEE